MSHSLDSLKWVIGDSAEDYLKADTDTSSLEDYGSNIQKSQENCAPSI